MPLFFNPSRQREWIRRPAVPAMPVDLELSVKSARLVKWFLSVLSWFTAR